MLRPVPAFALGLAVGLSLGPIGCARNDVPVVVGRQERDGSRRPDPDPSATRPWTPPVGEQEPAADIELTLERLRSGDLQGRILHGCRPLFSRSYHDQYLAAFPETKSILVGTDTNLGSPRFSPAQKLSMLEDAFGAYPDEMPFLSILYTKEVEKNVGRGLDPKVLAGELDRELLMLGRMIKGFGRPTFVRIGPEFNGKWSGYAQETFVDSFRYIVEFFRTEGVDNAIFVWNYLPQAQAFPYMDWYPGDDVVDWWSVDVFEGHFTRAQVQAELQRYLDDARAHGKPVIIAESGPSKMDVNEPHTWSRWFAPYFALINEDENIKAFVYSNVDFGRTTTDLGWKDVQLQGSAMAERYQQELRKPQYVHQPR